MYTRTIIISPDKVVFLYRPIVGMWQVNPIPTTVTEKWVIVGKVSDLNANEIIFVFYLDI